MARLEALVGHDLSHRTKRRVQRNDSRARETLFEEGYALALWDKHPLAHRHTLEPDEIADADMLVRRNCEALPSVRQFFTQRGIRPFFAARTTNNDRAVFYVRSGLGVTVMPRCFAQAAVVMPSLSEFGMRRKIGLLVDPSNLGRVNDSQYLRHEGGKLSSMPLWIAHQSWSSPGPVI